MECAMGPAEYLRVLRSRWWVVAVLVLVGAGVAWITTPSQPSSASSPATYRATTVLVKGQSATGVATDGVNLALAGSLAGAGVVIERSATELGVPATQLTTGLEVGVNDKAGTLQISTLAPDRSVAIKEADTIAAQLVTFLAERRQQQLDPLIASTTDRINTLQSQVKALDAQVTIPGSPEADLQRTQHDSVLRQLGASLDSLQQLNAQAAGAANQLVILAPAVAAPETASSGFSVPTSQSARAAIGLVVGLLAGLALVIAYERVNPKVRTTAQAELVFGLPVIAEIPRQSRRQTRRRGMIATFSEPHSVAAESYRSLRTSLMYMPRSTDTDTEVVDRFANGHVVLVTSASPSEGKTTVVANLAAAFAEKEGEVVVVSGDARQPAIETLLLGRRAAGAKLAAKERADALFTTIPGVRLVLSCDPNTNPADIVGFEREVAQQVRARSQTAIIDTPPALIANDATELMHVADSVVLVARCGATSVASARRTAELIARLRVTVAGVVLVGTDAAAVAGSSYYRNRTRRTAPTPRTPYLPAQAPPPRVEIAPPPAPAPAVPRPPEPVTPQVMPPVVAPAPVVDDGGIWRPKPVIDLSAPHEPSATVGKGFPGRDALASNGGDLTKLEEQRLAYHARNGHRGRLPLFRAGDGTDGRSPR
jgi:Mrp family chromosome partitioning ATPase